MSQERYTQKVYNMLVHMDNTGKENKVTWIWTFPCSHGFIHIWLHQGTGNSDRLISDMKAKLTEMSAQTWQANLRSGDRYNMYVNF